MYNKSHADFATRLKAEIKERRTFRIVIEVEDTTENFIEHVTANIVRELKVQSCIGEDRNYKKAAVEIWLDPPCTCPKLTCLLHGILRG